MKKIFTLAAVAALVLSACAKIETEKVIVDDEPIGFGVYVPQATKAGDAGTITTDGSGSTVSLQTVGFGVFATYSNGGNYAATIGPNFMYNTKVSTASWTYSPVKYWPNETIDDNNGATGPAAADKLSFLAYAPYVKHNNATSGAIDGDTSYGITALTGNAATTDPKVSYTVATDPKEAVDLLWAVAPASFTYKDVHNADVTVAEGMPLLNLTKPAHDYVIRFNFKHATSRLGLKIIGAFDQVAEGGTLDNKTKVTVKEIKLVDVPAYTSAVLNLNNTAAGVPLWESATGTTATFTVDGTNLNSTIKDSGTDAVQTVEGVIASEKNVFVDDNTFFTLIPKAGSTDVKVQITYYVTTEDADLKGGFSRVENVITKTVNFASGFAAGKANTIKITLGLTSVKLDAVVENWDVLAATNVDLPINH